MRLVDYENAKLARTECSKAALAIFATDNYEEAAKQAFRLGASARTVEGIEKAAVAAATLGNSGIGTALGPLLGGLISGARGQSALDVIADAAFPLPIGTGNVVVSSTISVGSVNEGAAKPIRGFTLTPNAYVPVKCAATVVMTKELLREKGVERIVTTELEHGVALASDTLMFAALTGNSGEASDQNTFAGFLSALEELLRSVTVGAESKLFLIVSPAVGKAIGAQGLAGGLNIPWNGGQLAGIEIVVSAAQTSDRITLVDASGIGIARTPLSLRSSDEGSIDLNTAPTGNTTTPTATTLVSLWQTNCRALIAERNLVIEPLRPNAYWHLTGVAFGLGEGSSL